MVNPTATYLIKRHWYVIVSLIIVVNCQENHLTLLQLSDVNQTFILSI